MLHGLRQDEQPRALESVNVLGMTVSFVAFNYFIRPSKLFRWRNPTASARKRTFNPVVEHLPVDPVGKNTSVQ
jgi:hypothetical protein